MHNVSLDIVELQVFERQLIRKCRYNIPLRVSMHITVQSLLLSLVFSTLVAWNWSDHHNQDCLLQCCGIKENERFSHSC